eukprot:3319448-Amphidinium_carterae.1
MVLVGAGSDALALLLFQRKLPLEECVGTTLTPLIRESHRAAYKKAWTATKIRNVTGIGQRQRRKESASPATMLQGILTKSKSLLFKQRARTGVNASTMQRKHTRVSSNFPPLAPEPPFIGLS